MDKRVVYEAVCVNYETGDDQNKNTQVHWEDCKTIWYEGPRTSEQSQLIQMRIIYFRSLV